MRMARILLFASSFASHAYRPHYKGATPVGGSSRRDSPLGLDRTKRAKSDFDFLALGDPLRACWTFGRCAEGDIDARTPGGLLRPSVARRYRPPVVPRFEG